MSNSSDTDSDETLLFTLRDACLQEHQAVATVLAWTNWYAWYERQQDRTRMFELRFKDGQLVGARDITRHLSPSPHSLPLPEASHPSSSLRIEAVRAYEPACAPTWRRV